jgi:hypothetical protein
MCITKGAARSVIAHVGQHRVVVGGDEDGKVIVASARRVMPLEGSSPLKDQATVGAIDSP